MIRMLLALSLAFVLAMGLGCKKDAAKDKQTSTAPKGSHGDSDHAEGDGHDHGDDHTGHAHGGDHGDDHSGHDHGDDHAGHDHGDGDGHGDHAHGGGHDHGDEIKLGTAMIGDLEVAALQGHGEVQAGKESHLVVKLPYRDFGATIVRAWLGTKNRTLSFVGKGQYAEASDNYNVHANAPNPLPGNVMWWIEIEKPNGTTLVGSIKPLVE